jgi:hypothetical protein
MFFGLFDRTFDFRWTNHLGVYYRGSAGDKIANGEKLTTLSGYRRSLSHLDEGGLSTFLGSDMWKRRWSIGSLGTKESGEDLWYLGGPVSFVNGACVKHANAVYDFRTKEQCVTAIGAIFPGEEILICYDSTDLDGTCKVIQCSDLLCRAIIMSP